MWITVHHIPGRKNQVYKLYYYYIHVRLPNPYVNVKRNVKWQASCLLHGIRRLHSPNSCHLDIASCAEHGGSMPCTLHFRGQPCPSPVYKHSIHHAQSHVSLLTLLEADSSGPSEGSKATPSRAPLPKEPVLLRVDGCEGWSEIIESPSRKFSAQTEVAQYFTTHL